MTDRITAAVWPEGQQEAARRALADDLALGVVEEDPVEVPLRRLDSTLTHLAPAVLPCGDGMLALRRVGRRTVSLVGPHGRLRLRRAALVQALTQDVHQTRAADLERLAAGGRPHDLDRFRTRHRWLSIVAGEELVPLGTRLRPADPRQASTVARRGSAVGLLVAAVLLQLAAYAVVLSLWAVVGQAAIAGTLGQATAWAWAGLGGLWAGLQVAASWLAGRAAVEVSTLLRAGLLDGALVVPPDRVRHLGAGQLLGTVLQTRPIEALAGSGATLALIGATQVVSGVVAAALGHRAAAILVALMVWLTITAVLAVRQARLEGSWADLRTDMTDELVERLVGHRTRLAQNARGMRDRAADEAQLEVYERLSRRLDRVTTALISLVPRGFVASALAVVVLPASSEASVASLAISLGAVLLIGQGLTAITIVLTELSAARAAWTRLSGLLGRRRPTADTREVDRHDTAARTADDTVAPTPLDTTARFAVPAVSARPVVLQARGLTFGHDPSQPVLQDVDLSLARGDRVLLSGPSGGGKSTLVSLLAGLRPLQAGEVWLPDEVPHTSREWRRQVVAAPQFHENLLLTGSLLYNLLVGRRWPPRPEDVEAADQICRALGLGPLLVKMPGGIGQVVGDTGWQLSHGERSRVFIARALLQSGEVVVLDESLASLDPATTRDVLAAVDEHVGTLLLVAHP